MKEKKKRSRTMEIVENKHEQKREEKDENQMCVCVRRE